MTISDWSTVAELATALGTLILAVATFSSVRSSNLMAKVAQQQLLVQLRPVLTTSRREDPTLKVNFGDEKWVRIPGGGAVAQIDRGTAIHGDLPLGLAPPAAHDADTDTAVVYLAIALRNAGNGIAVLHGWRFFPELHRDQEHAPLEEFRPQSRDLYIPVNDVGFWQGAFRNPEGPGYAEARKEIEAGEAWTVELLYSDHDGGQRAISRFIVLPVHPREDANDDGPHWLASASRHWSIDYPAQRS
jgi:hypothetical protein